MITRRFSALFIICYLLLSGYADLSAQNGKVILASDKQAEPIHELLDAWHDNAANGEFEAYFSKFASNESIFMGTDKTERWTIGEFKEWSRPYFDRGKAWAFTATSRTIYFNSTRSVAWFDEQLDTPNLGPARGSGILVKEGIEWKIAHYNLSIPIPNPLVDGFVELIEVWENNQKEQQ